MKKKIMSLVLALVMCVGLAVPAFAANISTDVYVCGDDELDEYAEKMAKLYVPMKLESGSTEVYLSQAFKIIGNDDNNKRIYFIFDGNMCVAEMIVTYLDGEFVSSYTHGDIPVITEAYCKSEPFYLEVSDEGLYYCSGERMVDLYHPEAKAGFSAYSSQYDVSCGLDLTQSITLRRLVIEPAAASLSYGSDFGNTLTDAWGHLDVPFVANAVSPDTGAGLCWAAAASSLAAYRLNETPLSAVALYQAIETPEHPHPNANQIGLVWKYYGITCTNYRRNFYFADVQAKIKELKPGFVMLTNDNKTAAHAVVICGWASAQGGFYFYEILNSNNMKGTTTLTQVSPANVDFAVVESNMTYTKVGEIHF